jgi:hypothetical protein
MSKMIKADDIWIDLDKVRYITEHPHTYTFTFDGGENSGDRVSVFKDSINILEVINQMNHNT